MVRFLKMKNIILKKVILALCLIINIGGLWSAEDLSGSSSELASLSLSRLIKEYKRKLPESSSLLGSVNALFAGSSESVGMDLQDSDGSIAEDDFQWEKDSKSEKKHSESEDEDSEWENEDSESEDQDSEWENEGPVVKRSRIDNLPKTAKKEELKISSQKNFSEGFRSKLKKKSLEKEKLLAENLGAFPAPAFLSDNEEIEENPDRAAIFSKSLKERGKIEDVNYLDPKNLPFNLLKFDFEDTSKVELLLLERYSHFSDYSNCFRYIVFGECSGKKDLIKFLETKGVPTKMIDFLKTIRRQILVKQDQRRFKSRQRADKIIKKARIFLKKSEKNEKKDSFDLTHFSFNPSLFPSRDIAEVEAFLSGGEYLKFSKYSEYFKHIVFEKCLGRVKLIKFLKEEGVTTDMIDGLTGIRRKLRNRAHQKKHKELAKP
jgi:hypothetical protein